MNQRNHTRRSFLRTVGMTAATLAATSVARGKSAQHRAESGQETHARPRNIVFIESDSMDGRPMGCMGHPAAYTPNMDRLAARGVLFRNHYCNSPQCCPSRSSMWSGLHTHNVEGWNNNKGMDIGAPTFLTHLKDAGYQADIVGKTDYVSGGHSVANRVWAWTRAAEIDLAQKVRPVAQLKPAVGNRCHGDWRRIDQTVEWLKEHGAKDGKPFFAYCGTGIPHPGFRTSRYWLDKIDADKVDVPPYEKDLHPVMRYMSATKATLGEFSDKEIRAVRRTYFAMIAELDAMIGEIMDTVDELDLTDSTYFIYTSDHGEMNMEHRQYLKNSLHEGSARVPLIIAGPGVRKGVVVDDLVSLIDMYPTLMDFCGLPHPKGLDGHSLMPLMRGEASDRPDWVLSQYHSNFAQTGIFMLRQGDWKYIAYAGYEPQLFNLKDDPDEMTNLVASNPDKVREMDAKLREVVDYEAVDKKVKAYDRERFEGWVGEIGEDKLAKFMRNPIYKTDVWTEEHDAKLAAWRRG